MQNPKTGGSRWVPDIRPENIDTYTEQDGEQNAQYKIVDAHPIIGGVLDKLAFFRTHASAVWYNKMKNITVLQKLDNLASNIGILAQLATTDKSSLVGAVNELNGKMMSVTSVSVTVPNGAGGTGTLSIAEYAAGSKVVIPVITNAGSANWQQSAGIQGTLLVISGPGVIQGHVTTVRLYLFS